MAQDFSLRYPLVDGHGNFGSLDGDCAGGRCATPSAGCSKLAGRAARRARQEDGRLAARTTTARAPSRSCCRRAFPNLLVNGAQGIAVGMATNIPPHNLGEVVDALRRADRRPRARDARTCSSTSRARTSRPAASCSPRKASCARSTRRARARSSCAASGSSRSPRGASSTDARHHVDPVRRRPSSRSSRRSASIIRERKLPHAARRARRVAPTDVRIVLEIKKDADPAAGDGVPVQAHAAADERAAST